MSKVDISGKRTINIYNRAWVEWILQQQHIEVEAELSGEFQFIARATDSLLQVIGIDGQFLVLTELQFRYDAEMPDRLIAYAALARRKYKLDVFVTVVYLFPPTAGVMLSSTFHREFMGQVAHQDFQVIALWELEAEQMLAYDNPALLPFVPLMRGGNTEQIVRKCAERIRREPGALELETILSVFAGYVFDTELIKQILRWEMEIVKESPIIQELLIQERQLGFEEGKREATLNALRQTLTVRFEVGIEEFDEYLEPLDLQSLEQLNQTALRVQTLAEFERALADLRSKLEVPE
jgi:hypothetical protein